MDILATSSLKMISESAMTLTCGTVEKDEVRRLLSSAQLSLLITAFQSCLFVTVLYKNSQAVSHLVRRTGNAYVAVVQR